MVQSGFIRRALPVAFLTVTAAAVFAALDGFGGTVWGSALKSRHRFIPVASLPPPGFVQRFYRDIAGMGIAPTPPSAPLPRLPYLTISEHTLTFFTGDPDELANVVRAVEGLNNATIAAGAEFSFNGAVGERTEERGFRPGLMYVSGRVVSGIGGGVCIPSTALYNAALEAGLEIVERHHHSGPVRYAEPGRDAAVVYGFKDFRFRNNTDGPLTIRAAVEGDTLTVSLLARKATGWRVVVDTSDAAPLEFEEETILDPEAPEGEPVVEQTGRAGFRVTVVRSIYQGDRLLRRETVSRDVVAARNRILRMNPKDDPNGPVPLLADTEAPAPEATPEPPKPSPLTPPAAPEPVPAVIPPPVEPETVEPVEPGKTPEPAPMPAEAAPVPEAAAPEDPLPAL